MQTKNAILFILLSISLTAYSQGIDFKGISFKEALAQAKKENKLIFADISNPNMQTADRGQVEKTIFADKINAEFINKNFISIRVNMWEEENKYVGGYLQMNMYPAYFFFDSQGDLLELTNAHTLLKDSGLFLSKAKSAYEKGEQKRKNKRSIQFSDITFSEALARSAKENKPVFFDTYTTWCRPCIEMARNVFTLDTVADFYNANFINLKMDMEKGEGPQLAKKYNIKAYPTYLYLNSKGEVIYETSGSSAPEKFIEHGHIALDSAAIKNKTGSIQFEKPESLWADTKAKALQESKLIFFDAYTTWCGPCKKLEKEIFTLPEVGNFFNTTFINARFDMEKGEGINLAKEFNIKAYPTLLFIDGNGKIIHQVVGYMKGEDLLAEARKATSQNNLSAMNSVYKGGQYDNAFLEQYLITLSNAYLSDKADTVAETYMSRVPKKEWASKANWTIIQKYIRTPSSEVFTYLVKNREKFYSIADTLQVDNKISQTFISGATQFIITNSDNTKVLDIKGFDAYLKKINSVKFDKCYETLSYTKITTYRNLAQWDNFAVEIEAVIRDGKLQLNTLQLYNYALVINRSTCTDEKICRQAIEWLAKAIEKEKYKEFIISYKKIQADLHEKTGDLATAKKLRDEIAGSEKPKEG